MKLIDASAWVQFLRRKGDPAVKQAVARLLQTDQAAFTCPIRFELLSGVKPDEVDDLEQAFALSHHFPFEPADWQAAATKAELHEAYFHTPVLPAKRHAAALSLLHIFADHLGMVSNQIMARNAHAEPPMITRAKQFIEAHHTEDFSLGMLVERAIQRAGHTSASATSGLDAILWLGTHRPTLLLLDLKLRNLEAPELISQLETLGRTVPFLVITGQGDELHSAVGRTNAEPAGRGESFLVRRCRSA